MPRIAEILDTMEYGPAPEDSGIARDWLARHEATASAISSTASSSPRPRAAGSRC